MSRQIPVTPERFERAITRAIERDYQDHIDYRWTYCEAGQPAESFFEVESSSQPSEIHGVRVYVDGDDVTVTCSCECGLHAKYPCWHQAGTLMLAGFLATPDPDEPTEEERRAYEKAAMDEIYAELDTMYARNAWEAQNERIMERLHAVPF